MPEHLKMDCAVHNIATREIIDLMKNNVKNTHFQGKNRVFVGIVSRFTILHELLYYEPHSLSSPPAVEDDPLPLIPRPVRFII